jgi:hypothetical protein
MVTVCAWQTTNAHTNFDHAALANEAVRTVRSRRREIAFAIS